MENKARYTLVGVFVIIFVIAMSAFLLWQARYNAENGNALEYRVYTKESIAGLNENSFVQYKGLNIGYVEAIGIDPKNNEQIEITLKISTPEIIKRDSYAVIQSQGITGNKNVEINGGTNDSEILPVPKGGSAVIPLKLSFLDRISNDAQGITQKVDMTLTKANRLLDEKNLRNIERILENLNKASSNFNELVLNLNHTVNRDLAANLNTIEQITAKLDKLLDKNVPRTLEGIDGFTSQWSGLSKEIELFLNEDMKKLVKNVNNSLEGANNIDEVLLGLQNTLQRVDGTLDEFNENGGNMIFNTRDIKYGPGEDR